MRASRPMQGGLRRAGTKLMNQGSMVDYNTNIFEQHEMQLFADTPPNQTSDQEKPRANLYNVIKKLRESVVSYPIHFLCAFAFCNSFHNFTTVDRTAINKS